jgi:carbamoyl-phosphate synthase large subunit
LRGKSLQDQGYQGGLWPKQPLIAVKAPVFSMAKLRGVEVNLGPEMKSTGEVMGIDKSFEPAFYKALVSAGLAMKPKGAILISLADEDKADSIQMVRELVQMGHKLYATEGTAAWIQRAGIPVQMVTKRFGKSKPDVMDVILDQVVSGVINTPGPADKEILDGLEIRRAAVERGIPCVTSIDTARAMVSAMSQATSAYSVQPLAEYRKAGTGY